MTEPEFAAGAARDADRLAFFILKAVNQAVREFDMIRPDDRVAVAVSGGKDSLALLRLLQIRRTSAQAQYSITL